MMKLYIARHGETEWNRAGKLQGWKDAPLTEKGKKQAKALGRRLKEIGFDAVYSSPLGRTLKTAEIALDGKDLPVNKDERLKEIDMGEWEGTKADKIKEMFPDLYEDFWERPHRYDPEDGESFDDVKERVLSFLDEMIEKHDGETILIFSHGCASKVMMTHFGGRSLSRLWDPPELKECSLNLVEIEDGESDIILFGDTSFL